MKEGKTRRVWAPEQKAKIVRKHLEEHVSVRMLEQEYQANRGMICCWIKEYIAEGESSFERNCYVHYFYHKRHAAALSYKSPVQHRAERGF